MRLQNFSSVVFLHRAARYHQDVCVCFFFFIISICTEKSFRMNITAATYSKLTKLYVFMKSSHTYGRQVEGDGHGCVCEGQREGMSETSGVAAGVDVGPEVCL